MRELSNEQLMAYADGELSPDEGKAIEEQLASNPDAVARLEAFTATKEPLSDAFDHPTLNSIPKRLLDILEPSPGAETKASVSKKGLLQELLDSIGLGGFGLSPALAFSALILMSVGSGWLIGRMGVGNQSTNQEFIAFDSGSIRATGAMGEALEHTPSSKFASWSGLGNKRVSLKPVLSFRTKDQRFCRQYELNSPASGSFAGLACRDTDGAWHIKMHEKTAVAAPKDGRTVPANGRKTLALDAVVDQMIAGPAMGADEEANLMQNRWQEKP